MPGTIDLDNTIPPQDFNTIPGPMLNTDYVIVVRGNSTYISSYATFMANVLRTTDVVNANNSNSVTAPAAANQVRLLTDALAALTTTVGLKLNTSDYHNYFKGAHATLAALRLAHPTGIPGDYAGVDAGVENNVVAYYWDDNDNDWVTNGSVITLTTTDELPEGINNLYFHDALAIAAVMPQLAYIKVPRVVIDNNDGGPYGTEVVANDFTFGGLKYIVMTAAEVNGYSPSNAAFILPTAGGLPDVGQAVNLVCGDQAALDLPGELTVGLSGGTESLAGASEIFTYVGEIKTVIYEGGGVYRIFGGPAPQAPA